jgi:hypothetical protein
MKIEKRAKAITKVRGVHELARETLTIVGEKLLRGDSARVVSAWRQMPDSKEELLDSEAAYELWERVGNEIGNERAEVEDSDGWIYGAFVEVRLAYEKNWPTEALKDYLSIFEGDPNAELTAQAAWQRALESYVAIAA